MTEPKSLFTFFVSHGIHKLRVIVFQTVKDVHREYKRTMPDAWHISREGKKVHGFFYPAARLTKGHAGTIVLPLIGRLEEFVPHEVFHAVFAFYEERMLFFEEDVAASVGIFSAKILEKIKAYRNE